VVAIEIADCQSHAVVVPVSQQIAYGSLEAALSLAHALSGLGAM